MEAFVLNILLKVNDAVGIERKTKMFVSVFCSYLQYSTLYCIIKVVHIR